MTSHMPVMPKHFAAILGDELAMKYFNDGQPHGAGTILWHELDTAEHDLMATKSGASAFFPGKCDLKEQLDSLDIDTLLVAGAVTNICCESSARDAVELDYKVILVSDGFVWTRTRTARGHAGNVLSHIRGCPSERRNHRPSRGDVA